MTRLTPEMIQRSRGSRKSKKRWVVPLLIAFLLACSPFLPPILLTAYLLHAMQALAGGDTAQNLPVEVETIRRELSGNQIEAVVYRPKDKAPHTGILLVAGVSELGCYHPRLVALSRTLAYRGFLVVTPDISALRNFMVRPGVVDEIAFWFRQFREIGGGSEINVRGLAGISFSGTLCLMVGARPDIRDTVGFILAIGPYQDLARCSRGWFAAGPVTAGEGRYPTRYYGKWVIMLSALEMLPEPEERDLLHQVLVQLLVQGSAPPAPESLSPQAKRWYALAVMREDASDPELAGTIENHLQPLFRQLSPDRSLGELRAPVFITHGAHDDLIPPGESRELMHRIGGSAYLLVSPFLTHTHPFEQELSWGRRVQAAVEMTWFFYRLARVVD